MSRVPRRALGKWLRFAVLHRLSNRISGIRCNLFKSRFKTRPIFSVPMARIQWNIIGYNDFQIILIIPHDSLYTKMTLSSVLPFSFTRQDEFRNEAKLLNIPNVNFHRDTFHGCNKIIQLSIYSREPNPWAHWTMYKIWSDILPRQRIEPSTLYPEICRRLSGNRHHCSNTFHHHAERTSEAVVRFPFG